MKLWLLKPIKGSDYWRPWYDKAFGFVIRAETEQRAREWADSNAGDENRKGHPWLNSEHSTCIELTIDGPEEMVLRDFMSA